MGSSANPILSTVETIKGYPSILKLFMCGESRYWQVQAYLDNRIVRRSTKTVHKKEAIEFAKRFYNEQLLKLAQHQPLTSSGTFEVVANELFKEDQSRVDRGERKQSVVDDSKYIYEADLLKFFGRTHVKDISYKTLNDYVAHLKTSRTKALSTKTIKNHFIVLSKILRHAHKLGYIDKLPIFPTLTTQDNPREWFTEPQYGRLLTAVDKLIEEKAVVRFHPVTKELRLLVTFFVNSPLRPQDLPALKHKHIERASQGDHDYLRIMAYSKTKASPVVTKEACVAIYTALKQFNKGHASEEDYVFFPQLKNRGYAMETMRRQFNEVLALAELKLGPGGKPRTLYSLRHTYVMDRLLNGKNIDLLTLARNCRTSPEMISRFYAAHLTAEMNVERLNTNSAKAIEQGSNLEALLTEDE